MLFQPFECDTWSPSSSFRPKLLKYRNGTTYGAERFWWLSFVLFFQVFFRKKFNREADNYMGYYFFLFQMNVRRGITFRKRTTDRTNVTGNTKAHPAAVRQQEQKPAARSKSIYSIKWDWRSIVVSNNWMYIHTAGWLSVWAGSEMPRIPRWGIKEKKGQPTLFSFFFFFCHQKDRMMDKNGCIRKRRPPWRCVEFGMGCDIANGCENVTTVTTTETIRAILVRFSFYY